MEINREAIENKVRECLAKGNRRYKAKARISKIVYMSNATNNTGKAVSDGNGNYFIKLSRHYLEHEFEWMLNEIIPHEVAHIIGFWLEDNGAQGSYGHDERWREIAIFLGSTGEQKPQTPDTYAHKSKFHYKTTTGNDIYLDQDRHDAIQNNFKVLRDTRDGGRITAAGYVKQ